MGIVRSALARFWMGLGERPPLQPRPVDGVRKQLNSITTNSLLAGTKNYPSVEYPGCRNVGLLDGVSPDDVCCCGLRDC
jgi:hypothetical protein